MTGNGKTRRRYHLSLALLLLGGCDAIPFQTQQVFYTDTGDFFRANYSTFEHAFTDAGAEDARRRAASQCAQVRLVAVKTTSRCSLTRCTTSFQCMEPGEAANFRDDGGKR